MAAGGGSSDSIHRVPTARRWSWHLVAWPVSEETSVTAQPPSTAELIPTARAPRVLVGVDGSEGSLTALRWAVRWALVRGAEVTVLAAYATDAYRSNADFVDLDALNAVHDGTRARVQAAVRAVLDSDSAFRGVPVGVQVEPGPASELLVRRSADADLLVVGSRGHGAVRSALLGSVALRSVSAAECPVVVVPPPGRWADPATGARVVVGVDGSERQAAALTAALTEAGPGGSVTVVRARDVTDLWSDQYPVVAAPSQVELRADALQRLEVTLAGLLRATAGDRSTVQRIDVRGQAGVVLVEQAADADLLVIASRGHGEVRGLVFGSVALHCVLHAPCPVLVMRPSAGQLPARSTLADAVTST
jgi:nucleotide-binding universal stress UspA family protein